MKTSRITIETHTITIIRSGRTADRTVNGEGTVIEIDNKEVISDAGEATGDRDQEIRGNNEKKY